MEKNVLNDTGKKKEEEIIASLNSYYIRKEKEKALTTLFTEIAQICRVAQKCGFPQNVVDGIALNLAVRGLSIEYNIATRNQGENRGERKNDK